MCRLLEKSIGRLIRQLAEVVSARNRGGIPKRSRGAKCNLWFVSTTLDGRFLFPEQLALNQVEGSRGKQLRNKLLFKFNTIHEDSLKTFLRILCLIVFTSYQFLLPSIGQRNILFAQTSKGIDLHQKINLAQKLYFDGNFDSAIYLIKQCLQQGITADNEKVRAYKILAQAYLAKGFEQPAQEVVKKLLEIVPEYTPVIEEEPPQFVELVKKTKNAPTVKTEKPKSANNNKRTYWLWVGSAGVVLLGVTAILVLNGPESHNTDQDEPLPFPPEWPK